MSVIYSGDLRPFPGIDPSWDEKRTARAVRIVNEISQVLGVYLVETPGADVEDFWEDAYRMSGALLAAKVDSTDMIWAPDKTAWTDAEMAQRLGPVHIVEEGGHHAIDQLAAHPLVKKHGGRAIEIVTFYEDDDFTPADSVAVWMTRRYEAGVSHVVLKNRQTKNGIWTIETAAHATLNQDAVLAQLGWNAIALSDRTGMLVAQDMLDLQWEYRCFVVNGLVVSGAGCIEEFTPLDADPKTQPFDTRVRQYRGHLAHQPSQVEDRPEIVRELLNFARKVASEHPGTVVIDVALDASTGKPVVIELNGLHNSGLYASDPELVYGIVSYGGDRGYSTLPRN